jgi:carboxyl-terminal processing protease
MLSNGTGSGQTVKSDPEKEVNITLLWSVWRQLESHYIAPDKLKIQPMVYGAIAGMVDAVGDPYTVFMTPSEKHDFDDALSGTLEGIGAQLDMENGKVTVVAPLKSSPAEKAGLKPKDIIEKVDGMAVSGMTLDDVVSRIRGKKGTSVVLTVLHDGQTKSVDISVMRDAIHIPSVESSVVKNKNGQQIAVLTLNQFGDDSVLEMRKAITALPKDIKGVVLDLRYNGGGYLEGAVDIVSMFIKSGLVVTVQHRDPPLEQHSVTGNALLPDVPLAVLINGGSASASEITAGALQDLNRATIVGTQSYGKGTVQELLNLQGGASLRVTVAKWLTPAGHDLGKKGVTPDIVIDRTVEDYKNGKDPQLDAAVTWLTEHKDVTKMKTASGATK